jgi:hypothetical protein
MKLELYRINSQDDSTLGTLFISKDTEKEYLCFTLEDEFREDKVMAETRIPAGTYQICLREFGGHHRRYSHRFQGIHEGMLWLQDVPEFTDILIHCGNTDDDTAGCLLLGYGTKRVGDGNYTITHSTQAYMDVYPAIAKELKEGNEVTIKIIDFDEGHTFLGQ